MAGVLPQPSVCARRASVASSASAMPSSQLHSALGGVASVSRRGAAPGRPATPASFLISPRGRALCVGCGFGSHALRGCWIAPDRISARSRVCRHLPAPPGASPADAPPWRLPVPAAAAVAAATHQARLFFLAASICASAARRERPSIRAGLGRWIRTARRRRLLGRPLAPATSMLRRSRSPGNEWWTATRWSRCGPRRRATRALMRWPPHAFSDSARLGPRAARRTRCPIPRLRRLQRDPPRARASTCGPLCATHRCRRSSHPATGAA